MNAPLELQITDDARTQIAGATAWWAANRPAAPDAVLDELDRILGLLVQHPDIGARARRTTLTGVRRVTLFRIRYHLYYRVANESLQVLALWHTSQGRGPSL